MGETKGKFFCTKKDDKVVPFGYILRTSTGDLLPTFMRVMTHPIGESTRGVCLCLCETSLHISPMLERKLSEDLEVKRTQRKKTSIEGDEEPKSGRATRSLQHSAQTQQRGCESSQLRQHHPDVSLANPHHPNLL